MSILSPGAKVNLNTMIKETCEVGYHQVDHNRIMECQNNGRWEPFISNRLCLSKRFLVINLNVQ